MRKFFQIVTMLFFGLFAGVNTMWAEMTLEEAETQAYWARLVAQPSTGTKGSGKVLVSKGNVQPRDEDYQETSTASNYTESYIQALGNDEVSFYVYAKPNAGSYFTGWSDYNGGTEKAYNGITKGIFSYKISPKKGLNNAKEYTIYATFEPIRFVSYTIGKFNNNIVNVEFTMDHNIEYDEGGNKKDASYNFKNPKIIPKTGTGGTWSILDVWSSKPSVSGYTYKVPVKLADHTEPGEYAAVLTVTTKAGLTMQVPVYYRVENSVPGNAVLYDGKTQKHSGSVAVMLAEDISTYTNPILKLSGDCSDPIEINKDLTLDLNGYTLSNTLTVSGGNVTLAYSPYGGSATALNVTGGKAILNGGTFGSMTIGVSGTVVQNGATITGGVTNAGTLTTTDGSVTGALTSSATLVINGGTFTNTIGAAIAVSAGTAQIKKGTITGSTYGVETTGGTTTIEKLAVISGAIKALYGNGGTLTVNNGKFTDPADLIAGIVTFNAGYFQTATGPTALDKHVWRNTAGPEFREGYEFFVGNQAAAQASNVSVCRINQTAYASLEEALAYANNNPTKTILIFMENDYTLPAGYYTVPANATLIVPMEDDQNIAYPTILRRKESYVEPFTFRTLTFVSGVNMNVLGAIELSGIQYSITGNAEQSIPGGPFGHLVLKPGSHVTINNGGELRAWGYVTGDGTQDGNGQYLSGEIDARRGAIVREQFQIGDWKSGDVSFTMIQDKNPQQKTHLFPIYEYFIQNVESPVKYHPGSALYCSTSVSVGGNINAYANDIKVVGVNGEAAMFLMDQMADADNTWVRKWYDVQHDKQVYEVNSGAQLGSIVINLGEIPKASIGDKEPGTYNVVMDSRKFVLPLTSNMKIHLLSGNMQFTQSTSCLPGMEVEIDKESTITIINQGQDEVVEGALYLYDADQWGKYVMNGKYGSIVHYSATLGTRPTVRNVSSAAALGDAILNVHGTFQVGENCAVYTTVGKTENPSGTFTQNKSSGGASIISSNEDAGTFIFLSDAPVASGEYGMFVFNQQGELNPEILVNYDNSENGLVVSPTARGNSAHIYGFELCTSALLTNGDGSKTETAGTSANKSYCYIDGAWTDMKVDEDAECFMVDNYGTFYAKPAEYVAVNATWDGTKMVGNTDHTFSDKAGTGRLFILIKQDCQWWEVKKKDNLYHCIHPNNDTYYYWDEGKGEWVEKRFVITWKNWNGDIIQTTDENGEPVEKYSVTYGTMAEFLGSNPTREPNIDYTYDFTGWSPALGKVTSDVTYTATYNEQPRKYTVIFLNEGGTEIERQFLTHNEMPSCENVPTKVGHTLVWEPAIAAVTGDTTYRATWLEEPPTEYEIRFVDYDGSTELKKGNVAVGTMPPPPANPSGKPETSEFSYVFDHWSPALSKVTQAMTYTAVYSEVARTYTISYYNEEGSTVVSTEELPYGATPTPPVVTKENPETGHTYTLVWKNLDETGTIQTVQGAASYKPTYLDVLNKYTVTVKSNPSGACSSTGAGLYDYNTSAALTLSVNAGYTFNGWSDGLEGTKTTRTITVTEDKELVANFIVDNPDYTITWKNEAGTADLVAPVGQKAGTATIYPGATPTKDATAQYTYTFDGWATEANGPKVYKNGLTPVASGDATYYAHFSSTVNTYKVTLTSNPAGVCTFTGAGTYEYGADVAIDVASYNSTNYTFTGWSASVPTTVEGDINLTANFSLRTYTITWKSEDGSATLETDASQAYGAATAFNAAEPSKAGGVFAGWTTAANGEGSFYTNGSTPAVTGDATYFAYFNAIPQETLTAGVGDVVAAEAKAYASITITSNGTSSGQITNAGAITSCGDAYFELKPNKGFDALTWYAVAVPWQVSIADGIFAGETPLHLGSGFQMVYYNSEYRAANGRNDETYDSWIFMSNSDNMQPGKLYMMYVNAPATTIRFKKVATAPIQTTVLSVKAYPQTTGHEADAGWNGIANPALYHAYLNASATTYGNTNFGQKYIPLDRRYDPVDMSSNNLIVGEPIFVQVASDKPNVVACTTWSEAAAPAPRRRAPRVDNAYYEVQISAGEAYTDRLYLQTLEDKEDRYVIGLDLAKAGVSNRVAQMWVNRYNAQLCVNTTAPVGKTATYPLGISIPENGTYQISSATEMQANQELYVTRNGSAIWNLAYGPYTVTLDKGTYSEYGIKLIQSNAPAVTTGVDQTTNDKQQIQKVVIDNHVYIVREGQLYTITGQKVK